MRRALLCLFACIAFASYAATAQAIDIRVDPWVWEQRSIPYPYEGPGTPPENAFPVVCYIIGMPTGIIEAIRSEAVEAREAAAKGETIELPWTEKYKNGVPVPMYSGFYVIYNDFSIYYVGHISSPSYGQRIRLRELRRDNPRTYLGAPRWSWHGALSSLWKLAEGRTMVYTLGQRPDPDYVPKIRKPYVIPLADILKESSVSVLPTADEYDATVINPKPGMVFKVIDTNFVIP